MFAKMSGKCQGILQFPACIIMTYDENYKRARAVFF